VDSRELEALLRWLDQGAPSRDSRERGATSATAAEPTSPSQRRPLTATPKRLARVLARGLSHLPLDARQRERALALARDALPAPKRAHASNTSLREDAFAASGTRKRGGVTPLRPAVDLAALAAAVAYAIVYIDHVPLSQAEVAAPFRVAVAQLRGRFAELRAKLDIIRGDARYATTRR
jgi:hypothetical protein